MLENSAAYTKMQISLCNVHARLLLVALLKLDPIQSILFADCIKSGTCKNIANNISKPAKCQRLAPGNVQSFHKLFQGDI